CPAFGVSPHRESRNPAWTRGLNVNVVFFFRAGAAHDDALAGRQRVEKYFAVALCRDAAVEQDDDPAIGLAANQPAETLLEFDDRFGDGIFHERISAATGDRFEAGFGQRLIGYREGELDDDDIAQRFALHIDALPEAGSAKENGVFGGAETIEKNLARRILALNMVRQSAFTENRLKSIRGVGEHFVAGEKDERPAVGHAEVFDDLLASGRKEPLC